MDEVNNPPFYGRQKYLNDLAIIFDDRSQVVPQLVLIGGVAGIGKTSLVEHFLYQKINKTDVLVRGKFDENKSSNPYQGIVDAIHNYAHELAKSPESVIKRYGHEISTLLEPNLKILLELVPEFEKITGKAEDLQILPAMESHNRFLLVINKILEFIAAQHGRLILYVDDLHWADKDTMKLLESILQNEKLQSALIIGTYRFEEVGVSHALASSIRDITKLPGKIHRLDLQELEKSEISEIINGEIIVPKEQSLELTDFLYEKMSGNPLYLKELLSNIILTGLSKHKNEQGIDMSWVKKMDVPKSLVDLLILKLKKLSSETQQLLKFAACLGTFFDSRMLSDLFELSVEHVEKMLLGGIDYGVVSFAESGGSSQGYHFVHDRVRESAYEMIEDKPLAHLKLARFLYGKQLYKFCDAITLDDVVYHFNAGNHLITSRDEKLMLSRLNLATAISAKNSGAYTVAISNLQAARKLLPIDSWTIHHELTYDIYNNLAETTYLDGDFEAAEKLCHLCLERVTDVTEKAEIYKIKVIELTNLGDWSGALQAGFEGLALFNINLEDEFNKDGLTQRLAKLTQQELLDLPELVDPKVDSLLSLLNVLVSPVYVLRPDLLESLVVTMLNLSIENGNSVNSVYAYVIYGMLLGPVKGEYLKANEFSETGLQINEKYKEPTMTCKTKLTYYTNISPWVKSIRNNNKHLEEAATQGLNAGDIINSGYCLASNVLQLFSSGCELTKLLEYLDLTLSFLTQTKNPVVILVHITRQLILNLSGKSGDGLSISDQWFDEDSVIASMRDNGFSHGVHWYYVNKMLLAIINDDLTDALSYSENSASGLVGAVGQFSVADHYFYHSLILTRLIPDMPDDEAAQQNKNLTENLALLENWANLCPDNFQHKYLLVQAECTKSDKDFELVKELYEKSKNLALDNGFIQDAAICCARYAKACQVMGNQEQLADDLLIESAKYYQQWGATRLISS